MPSEGAQRAVLEHHCRLLATAHDRHGLLQATAVDEAQGNTFTLVLAQQLNSARSATYPSSSDKKAEEVEGLLAEQLTKTDQASLRKLLEKCHATFADETASFTQAPTSATHPACKAPAKKGADEITQATLKTSAKSAWEPRSRSRRASSVGRGLKP
jgi:hypothetical protein